MGAGVPAKIETVTFSRYKRYHRRMISYNYTRSAENLSRQAVIERSLHPIGVI